MTERYMKQRIRYITTGFEGVCTAVAFYADGRVLLLLEANDSTGRPIEHWIDRQYAEFAEKGEEVK